MDIIVLYGIGENGVRCVTP